MKKYIWTKKERDLARKLARGYRKKLNLDGWSIDICFESGHPERSEQVTAAHTKVLQEYEKMEITLFPVLLEKYRTDGKVYLEDSIRHK